MALSAAQKAANVATIKASNAAVAQAQAPQAQSSSQQAPKLNTSSTPLPSAPTKSIQPVGTPTNVATPKLPANPKGLPTNSSGQPIQPNVQAYLAAKNTVPGSTNEGTSLVSWAPNAQEEVTKAKNSFFAATGEKPSIDTPPPPDTPIDTTKPVFSEYQDISNQKIDALDALKKTTLNDAKDNLSTVNGYTQQQYSESIALMDELKKTMDDALAKKNAAIASGSEAQKSAANDAYEASMNEYNIAKEKAQNDYEQAVAKQKMAQDKAIMMKENLIAATGGFGSVAKNADLMNTILQGQNDMNNLLFNKTITDKELTNKITALNKTHQTDLQTIEANKQLAISESYDKYVDWVTKIQENKEMSVNEKYKALKDAQNKYTDTVASINQAAFQTKYDTMLETQKYIDTLKKQAQDHATSVMKDLIATYALDPNKLSATQMKQLEDLAKQAGYPAGIVTAGLNNLKAQKASNTQLIKGPGNVYYSVDKTTNTATPVYDASGKPLVGSMNYQLKMDTFGGADMYDPVNNKIIGHLSAMDLASGNFGGVGGAGTLPGSSFTGGTGASGITGTQGISSDLATALKIGQTVGWCGDYAGSISTAPSVGDTWENKKTKIQDQVPQVGDKLLIPLGVDKNGKGWGHVAVVIGYDASSGEITVVESNKDGRQNKDPNNLGVASIGHYNLNTLKNQYGDNFGFAKGQLKGDISKKIGSSTVTTPAAQSTAFSKSGAGQITNVNDLAVLLSNVGMAGPAYDQAFNAAMPLINQGEYTKAFNVVKQKAIGELTSKDTSPYSIASNSAPLYEQALSTVGTNKNTAMGPWKAVWESNKSWAGIAADPKYAEISQWIGLAEQPILHGQFGAALTPQELARAKKFLVDDKDLMPTVLMKLQNSLAVQKFVMDKQIAEKMGLPLPSLDDYVQDEKGSMGTDTSSGQNLGGNIKYDKNGKLDLFSNWF